jgi:hypothetical protein
VLETPRPIGYVSARAWRCCRFRNKWGIWGRFFAAANFASPVPLRLGFPELRLAQAAPIKGRGRLLQALPGHRVRARDVIAVCTACCAGAGARMVRAVSGGSHDNAPQ